LNDVDVTPKAISARQREPGQNHIIPLREFSASQI
jgi:hypothetical protein